MGQKKPEFGDLMRENETGSAGMKRKPRKEWCKLEKAKQGERNLNSTKNDGKTETKRIFAGEKIKSMTKQMKQKRQAKDAPMEKDRDRRNSNTR